MKFFWKIISKVYSDLVLSGLKIPKPQWLFNNPKLKLPCQYQGTIFADITFTDREKLLILEGLDDLHFFCNGLIELEIIFNLDPNDRETIKNNCVLLRAEEEHPSIVEADGYHESRILGLCEYMDNDTVRLYLVPKRLYNEHSFRTTAIHELGHFIALEHTARPSVMHKSNYNNVLYPTEIDAHEMARVWSVRPEDLRFFFF